MLKLRVNTQEFLDKNAIELERILYKKDVSWEIIRFEPHGRMRLILQKKLHFDLIWLGVWEYNHKGN